MFVLMLGLTFPFFPLFPGHESPFLRSFQLINLTAPRVISLQYVLFLFFVFFLNTSHYDTYNQADCLRYYVSAEIAAPVAAAKAQMGHGQFLIGCSVPRSPTHLVCGEKHLLH